MKDTDQQRTVESVWWTLRVMFGVVPLVAGFDKFLNLLTNWEMYLAPGFARIIPFGPRSFMYLVGIIEIVVGLALLFTPWTKVLAYVAAAWLACIAINLIAARFFDVAVRDIVMALSAVCLGRLSDVVHVPARTAIPLRPARVES